MRIATGKAKTANPARASFDITALARLGMVSIMSVMLFFGAANDVLATNAA